MLRLLNLRRSVSQTVKRKRGGNFVDYVTSRVRAGDGGNGIVHFGREPFKPIAPADGGNGGPGGSIWIEVEEAGRDLRNVRSNYNARRGGRGNCTRGKGCVGDEVVITVPKGTVISEMPPKIEEDIFDENREEVAPKVSCEDGQDNDVSDATLQPTQEKTLLHIDTSHPMMPIGVRFLIAAGGSGGKGNYHFLTATNRTPMECTEGEPGQARSLSMELKSISDIGLVGLPNAGKSSLIRAVSRCKTQIGNYAFTTLRPHLATINFADGFRMNLADMPGIIQGAYSDNRGLGHEFLRHIEKARLLVYIVDISRPEPWKDLEVLQSELECFQSSITTKKEGLVLANKCDYVDAQKNFEDLKRHLDESGKNWKLIGLSSKYFRNVSTVLDEMRSIVESNRKQEELLMKQQEQTHGRPPWLEPEFVRGVYQVTMPEPIGKCRTPLKKIVEPFLGVRTKHFIEPFLKILRCRILVKRMDQALKFDMAAECRKASKILNSFIKPDNELDQTIPPDLIANAKGLAILTVIKAGFIWSGRVGTGIVVARLSDGTWSAPSAIATGGAGFGLQIGAEMTHYVIILNNADAVKAFSLGGNVTLGGNLSVSAGPVGRTAEAAGTMRKFSAIFSYSKSKGLFAGVSLEGSVIVERKDANTDFYRRKITAKEILSGATERPAELTALYSALEERSGTVSPLSPNADRATADAPPNYPGAINAEKPPIPPRQSASSGPTGTFAIALFDFVAQRPDDLGFLKNDRITIVRKTASQNDWWAGSFNGKTGNFPANVR